ncbi:hypothetical protein [Rhodococcus sp. ABRD24]|uniref:hypothetical protein n=1 Tax=Rhodococcus sp. ABRD24 TaxID=2507582 RepID=UPI0013F1658D|nr:hypothetical protein [Rhodococcus sp. ABRD24]
MAETLESLADEVNQLALAKEQGIELMGPDGLLGQLTHTTRKTPGDSADDLRN